MIELYRKHGKMDQVIYLLRAKGSAVGQYNSKIQMCSELGKIHEAEMLFSEMVSKGFSPNLETYKTMIAMYTALKDWKRTFGYLRKMKKQGIDPDGAIMNSMLDMFEQDPNKE